MKYQLQVKTNIKKSNVPKNSIAHKIATNGKWKQAEPRKFATKTQALNYRMKVNNSPMYKRLRSRVNNAGYSFKTRVAMVRK